MNESTQDIDKQNMNNLFQIEKKSPFSRLLAHFVSSLLALGIFSLIFGVIYPLLCILILQLGFSPQANGSFINGPNGQAVGSSLLGQTFTKNLYFWGRPSASTQEKNGLVISGASNYSNGNPLLLKRIQKQVLQDKKEEKKGIPIDLVTTSGSGLDPHITIAAAFSQVPRIAQERELSEEDLDSLIQEHIQPRQWGFLGEPRVCVLTLNMALDQMTQEKENRKNEKEE